MKNKFVFLLTITALLPTHFGKAFGQGTATTFHGRLNGNGSPANGNYDLTFSLFDSDSGPNQVGVTIINSSVGVANGQFTTTLDFGTGIFTGPDRWLQIHVRTNGDGAFVPLNPRKKLTPAPYAITASSLSGTLPASQLIGTLPPTILGGTYTAPVTFNNAANKLSGDGGGLANVNALALGGLAAASFWQLGGNAGTTPGVNFLGTTDNRPLELKVNGQRALRLEPTTNSPNVIGGFAGNYVYSNAVGATISGGGGEAYGPNAVGTALFSPGGNFSSIGGGTANTIVRGNYSAIGGGRSNVIAEAHPATGFPSDFCNIGGGQENQIGGSTYSSIGGGLDNTFDGDFIFAGAISGGAHNFMYGDSFASTIGGGYGNLVVDGDGVTIAGGDSHSVVFATSATIGGGAYNRVSSSGTYAAIAGGQSNLVNAAYGNIPGGKQAAARNYGQQAYASGAFQNGGDAQTSVYVCRNTTTDSTQAELFLDGASRRMVVTTDSTWVFDVLVTGRASGGNSVGYHIRGVARNNAGATALIGSLTKTVLAENVAAWDATVVADDATDSLVVRVTGAASTAIRWVASVRTVEVTY